METIVVVAVIVVLGLVVYLLTRKKKENPVPNPAEQAPSYPGEENIHKPEPNKPY